MRYVTMTEFKQHASRILDAGEPTAILRNSKFEAMDDARVAELTQSILDQRSDVLAYLAKR